MKVSELMQDKNLDPNYEGWVTNDDYVFAIDTSGKGNQTTPVGDYAVVEIGIAGLDSQMNPVDRKSVV